MFVQTAGAAAAALCVTVSAEALPRAPWGDPDLQGIRVGCDPYAG